MSRGDTAQATNDGGLETIRGSLFECSEPVLQEAQQGSIGLKSGEYGGRNSSRACAPSTRERTSGA